MQAARVLERKNLLKQQLLAKGLQQATIQWNDLQNILELHGLTPADTQRLKLLLNGLPIMESGRLRLLPCLDYLFEGYGDQHWSFAWPDLPEIYRAKSAVIEYTHLRAITPQQLRDLGDFIQRTLSSVVMQTANEKRRVEWSRVNLYHINELFVMPLTKQECCSFVELVASGPQEPVWFVSHWWGTSFAHTMDMLSFHSKARQLDNSRDGFWICTFANNQHDLRELSQSDLTQTPFVKAILCESCQGTVMLMNETAEPFKRAWCTLENFVSTTLAHKFKEQHLLDIAATVQEGQQVFYDPADRKYHAIPQSSVLLKDDGKGQLVDFVEVHGARFPEEVARQGMRVDIAASSASHDSDKRNILRLVIDQGSSPEASGVPVPDDHPAYLRVNQAVQKIFAPRAFFQAAMAGDVKEVHRLLQSTLVNPDWQNARGSSSLLAACFKGHAEVVDILLDASVDTSLADFGGKTASHVAVENNQAEVLRKLLDARVDPNERNGSGATLLMQAASHCCPECVTLLLSRQADINATSDNGESALDNILVASRSERAKSKEVLRLLHPDDLPDGLT